MADSITSATRAGIDLLGLAIAQLRTEVESYGKLCLAFSVSGLLFCILSLTMDLILKNAPPWLSPMLGGMSLGFLAGAIWCMAHGFCLRRIALRCKKDNLLPFSQLIITFDKQHGPSVIDSLDKPILLLPHNTELTIPDGDSADALEDLTSTPALFQYQVRLRIHNNAVVAAKSVEIRQQEAPKSEEV